MISASALLEAVGELGLIDPEPLKRLELEFRGRVEDGRELLAQLRRRQLITPFQSEMLLRGQGSELVLRDYVISERIGQGGMGQVFKARHRRLHAIRAIKLINPDCLTSRQAVERFYREAQAVARLDHRNIIRAYDASEDNDRHFFVMEYVAGHDLGRLLQIQGRFEIGVACEYMMQAAQGLQHAHEKGLVHRDIKPSNLLVSADGVVKILDLGLAQLRSPSSSADEAAGQPLTPAGMMMGTPDFMAPEQAENSSGVDIRADIYSLGCSLYQLLAGNVPFPAPSLVEKLTQHLTKMPEKLSAVRYDVPASLVAVVEKMMAKKPSARYQTPAEVAEALKPFANAAPAPVTVAPQSAPPAENDTDAGQTPYFPQTLQVQDDSWTPPAVPPTDGSGTQVMTEGPKSLLASDNEPTARLQMPGAPLQAPRRSRRGLGVAAAALLVLGGGAAAFVWWNGQKPDESDKPPATDPNRDLARRDNPAKDDVRPKDDSKPGDGGRPKDRIGVKPGDKPAPPPDPFAATRPRAKGGQGSFDRGNGKAQAGVAPAGEEKLFQRVQLLAEFAREPKQVVLSADGSFAVAQFGDTLKRYRLRRSDGEPGVFSPLASIGNRFSPEPGIGAAALTRDGKRAAFATILSKETGATLYDAVGLWDWEGKSFAACFGDEASAVGKLEHSTKCLALTPDGTRLLTGTLSRRGPEFRVWDIKGPRKEYLQYSSVPFGFGSDLTSLVCSPDGKYALGASADLGLYLFSLAGKGDKTVATFKGHKDRITAVCFAGPKHAYSVDEGGKLLLWQIPEAATEKPVAPAAEIDLGDKAGVVVLAGGPGGACALGSAGKVQYRGKPGDREVTPYSPRVGKAVKALTFGSDGQTILVATEKSLESISLGPEPGGVGKSTAQSKVGEGRDSPAGWDR
jgi:serine/threonine-protein kinase